MAIAFVSIFLRGGDLQVGVTVETMEVMTEVVVEAVAEVLTISWFLTPHAS